MTNGKKTKHSVLSSCERYGQLFLGKTKLIFALMKCPAIQLGGKINKCNLRHCFLVVGLAAPFPH